MYLTFLKVEPETKFGVSFDQVKNKFAHLGPKQNSQKIKFWIFFCDCSLKYIKGRYSQIVKKYSFLRSLGFLIIFWKWKLCRARTAKFADFLDWTHTWLAAKCLFSKIEKSYNVLHPTVDSPTFLMNLTVCCSYIIHRSKLS